MIVVPEIGGLSICEPPDEVVLGRCYAKVEARADGTFEGVGGIVAGPVVFRARDENGPAYVSCGSCDSYFDFPYIDVEVGLWHARKWAAEHLCGTDGDEVR